MWFKQKYCINCKKILGKNAQYNRTKRCLKCNGIYLSKIYKGKNTSSYIDGRTNKKYYCIDCKKEISRYDVKRCCHCSNIYLHNIGKLNTKGKNNPMFGIHRFGKNAPGYIHGKCYTPYPVEWKEMRLFIRNKYLNKCIICNIKALHVHHIDYNKKNCTEDNLVLLCSYCHSTTNGNRDYWFAYFKYIKGE